MPTNLDSFYPFDAGAGSAITESQWRDMARHWLATGVLNGEVNEFLVAQRAAGANMSVDVATGRAWVRGHYGESTAVKNLSIATAHATNPRIDRVVLRADFAGNKVELDVLTGTPAGSPSAPALTQSTAMWEIPLARVAVAAAASSITTANITDERVRVGHARQRVESSRVVPSESTTSASFTDLTTAGPAVTVTTGTRARVTITAHMSNSTVGGYSDVSVALSGATTAAAALADGMRFEGGTANQRAQISRTVLFTNLTAGSNTFTLKYAAPNGGTSTFLNREIIVEAL